MLLIKIFLITLGQNIAGSNDEKSLSAFNAECEKNGCKKANTDIAAFYMTKG